MCAALYIPLYKYIFCLAIISSVCLCGVSEKWIGKIKLVRCVIYLPDTMFLVYYETPFFPSFFFFFKYPPSGIYGHPSEHQTTHIRLTVSLSPLNVT